VALVDDSSWTNPWTEIKCTSGRSSGRPGTEVVRSLLQLAREVARLLERQADHHRRLRVESVDPVGTDLEAHTPASLSVWVTSPSASAMAARPRGAATTGSYMPSKITRSPTLARIRHAGGRPGLRRSANVNLTVSAASASPFAQVLTPPPPPCPYRFPRCASRAKGLKASRSDGAAALDEAGATKTIEAEGAATPQLSRIKANDVGDEGELHRKQG